MDRWVGKVAIVTGASSGIGASAAMALAKAGMVTVGFARRADRVEELRADLPAEAASRLHAVACDTTKEEDILRAFKFVEETFGGVDVLINGDSMARGQVNLFSPKNTRTLREVVDTNIMGLVMCSREAFQSMQKRSVAGHIVNINSTLGHQAPPYAYLNIYPATKFSVTALTETMRHELRLAKTNIKVTSISPGMVRTEILRSLGPERAVLEPEDVADAILYVLRTPPRVQIHELTLHPVGV